MFQQFLFRSETILAVKIQDGRHFFTEKQKMVFREFSPVLLLVDQTYKLKYIIKE